MCDLNTGLVILYAQKSRKPTPRNRSTSVKEIKRKKLHSNKSMRNVLYLKCLVCVILKGNGCFLKLQKTNNYLLTRKNFLLDIKNGLQSGEGTGQGKILSAFPICLEELGDVTNSASASIFGSGLQWSGQIDLSSSFQQTTFFPLLTLFALTHKVVKHFITANRLYACGSKVQQLYLDWK